MGLWKRLVALLSVVLFFIILSRIDTARVFSFLLRVDFPIYIFSIFLLACLVSIKSFKWKLVLRSIGREIPFKEALRLFFIGLFIGNVTPGKLGDFAKAFYLRISAGTVAGIASVLLDRIIDVGLLLIFALIGSVSFIYFYNIFVVPPELILLVLLVFLAGIFLLFREEYLRLFLRPVFNALVPAGHKTRLSAGFSQVFQHVKSSVRKKEFWFSVAVGLAVWAVSAIFFYTLSVSLSLRIPVEVVLLIYPVISLLEILPISFSGVGTRDAAMIFLLSFFSIAPESAVALSLLFLFTGYFIVSAVGFLLFLLDPIDLKSFS